MPSNVSEKSKGKVCQELAQRTLKMLPEHYGSASWLDYFDGRLREAWDAGQENGRALAASGTEEGEETNRLGAKMADDIQKATERADKIEDVAREFVGTDIPKGEERAFVSAFYRHFEKALYGKLVPEPTPPAPGLKWRGALRKAMNLIANEKHNKEHPDKQDCPFCEAYHLLEAALSAQPAPVGEKLRCDEGHLLFGFLRCEVCQEAKRREKETAPVGDGHSHDWESCPKCVRLHARLPKFEDVKGILKEPTPRPDALRVAAKKETNWWSEFLRHNKLETPEWRGMLGVYPDVIQKMIDNLEAALALPPAPDVAGEELAKAVEDVRGATYDSGGTSTLTVRRVTWNTLLVVLAKFREAHPKAEASEDRIEEICEQYLDDLQSANLPGPDREAIVKEFSEFPSLDWRLKFVEMIYNAKPKTEGA